MIEDKNNAYQRLIRHMGINKTSGCWEWVGLNGSNSQPRRNNDAQG